MGRDRFVYWRKAPPTREAVLHTAREFFGPSALVDDDGGDCVTFVIGPQESNVNHPLATYARENDEGRGRWVELWFHDGKRTAVNVETRMSDAFTNYVADGFAVTLAAFYGGTLGEGVSRHEHVRFAEAPEVERKLRAANKKLRATVRLLKARELAANFARTTLR